MKVNRYCDAGAFLQATESWLATAEVENNIILSIARSVEDGSRTLKEPPYFAAAIDGDGIVCCATRTPPHVLLVTDGTSSGLAALAGDVCDAMGSLPGVVGPYAAPAAFADAWLSLAGGRGSVSMRQRLYKIERVNAGLPAMQGRLREATPGDRDLALKWCKAFAQEAVPNHPNDAEDTVDRHLKSGTLYFWDDGRPVSMCASPPQQRTHQPRLHAARLSTARLCNGRRSNALTTATGQRQTVLLSLCRPRKPNLKRHLSADRLSTCL